MTWLFLICFIVDQRAPARLDISITVLFGRIPVSLVQRAVLSDHFNLWDKRICRVFWSGTFEESKGFLSQLLGLRRFARIASASRSEGAKSLRWSRRIQHSGSPAQIEFEGEGFGL